jgi:hypothetical protein
MSYDDTIKALREASTILESATNHISSAFVGIGWGYESYYHGKHREATVTHFTGVPCYMAGEFNTNHMVMCVTPEGICYHPMGQCPERLPLHKFDAEPIGGEW